LLARSGARVHGINGYASGVALVAGLLDRHWADVHPKLEAGEGDEGVDSTMRMNALGPLTDGQCGLADLRHAALGSGRLAFSVRQIELTFGKVEPRKGESALSQDGVVQALKSFEAATPGVLAAMLQAGTELARIETILIDKVGGATGPDFRPLRTLARSLTVAAEQAGGGTGAQTEADSAALGGTPATAQAGAPGAMGSREDVIRTLERVCDWLERHEPTNPAPLLIRRAQRLMKKSFMEIIRDLAPDGVGQVEKIAGSTGE
jgi:type VI secretion system protein ImpA